MRESPTQLAALTCQRAAFDLPEAITYLNSAYMGPLSRQVTEAGQRAVAVKARPYEVFAQDFFQPLESLKSLFAQLVGARDSQRVAFQPSVSYGIATAVKNLPLKPGGNIVLLKDQFPSNVYAFLDLAKQEDVHLRFVAPPTAAKGRGAIWNQRVLEAIDSDTICVVCPHVHWADGTLFDLREIRIAAHNRQALLIVDGTQSIGALPFDVEVIQPDALVCAAYKFMLGPYNSALTYWGPAFDDGQPLEYNWIARIDSDRFGGLVQYQDEYRDKAFRYNMGECSNMIMIPMLQTTIQQILDWQVDRIHDYCHSLADPFKQACLAAGLQLDDRHTAGHLFGIYLNLDRPQNALKQRLESKQVFVSTRGEAVRVSTHVFNRPEDLDRLLSCLVDI